MIHTDKDGYTKNISSREYEKIKEEFAVANSLKMSGKNHWNFGKHWPKEIKEKLSKAKLGKKMSEDFCKKQSKLNSGKNNNMYGKNFQCYGLKRWTDQTKGKTFDEIFGEEKSKEIRKNLSDKTSGKNNPMFGKNVKDFMTQEAYNEMLKKRSIAMRGRKYSGQKLENMRSGTKKYWNSLSEKELTEIKEKRRLACAIGNLNVQIRKFLTLMMVCGCFK